MTHFVIKSSPDHRSLQEYLSDNPEPPCPIVGLENVTEFQTKDGAKRPFYHCSLGGCCHDQGDSRQMFQHLITFHHVLTWAQEHTDNVPEEEGKLIDLCRKLVEGDHSNAFAKVRTIISDRLHEKCRKAKIREVDLLLLKQNISAKKLNYINNGGGTVDDENNKSGSSNSPLTSNTEQTSSGNLNSQKNFEVLQELDHTYTEDEVRDDPASENEEIIHQKEKDAESVDHRTTDNYEDNTGTGGSFNIENPTASYFERNENAAYELPEIIEFGCTKASSYIGSTNISTLTAMKKEEPVSFTEPILPASQIHPYAPSYPCSGSNNIRVQSLPAIFPTYDTSSLSQSQLSLVSNRSANVEEKIHEAKSEILSPFVSYYDSPSFKEESPRDLLQAVSDNPAISSKTNQLEAANKDPEKVFYEKVVNMVKINLNRYFAKNSEDKFDKAGNPKKIKIKDSKEYASYCRHFSKKFSKDIKETFELTNGNLEGIEKLSVLEYGLEHDIHKHFSDRPCVA